VKTFVEIHILREIPEVTGGGGALGILEGRQGVVASPASNLGVLGNVDMRTLYRDKTMGLLISFIHFVMKGKEWLAQSSAKDTQAFRS
jgi:hypothetical protein